MAIGTPTAIVAYSATKYAAGATISTTVDAPAGSLIVAFIQNQTNTNVAYTGFIDSAGNSYSYVSQNGIGSGVFSVAIYACINSAHDLPIGGTVSFSGGGSGSSSIVQVYTVTGANGGADANNWQTSVTSGTSFSVTWPTLASSSSIIFTNLVFESVPSSFTEGSGFTTLVNHATSSTAADVAYQILSSSASGSYSPSYGTANGYAFAYFVFDASVPNNAALATTDHQDTSAFQGTNSLTNVSLATTDHADTSLFNISNSTTQIFAFDHADNTKIYATNPYKAPYPPTPQQGSFLSQGPTTQTALIPSYLYQQYTDDDDLQAFVASYNLLGQTFINTLNDLNLPIYTSANPGMQGELLDWVGGGLYGFPRPSLFSGKNITVGPLNTWGLNETASEFNQSLVIGYFNVVATTDDTYQRILTWNFWKGDGMYFTIRWLKRRVYRFLYGTGGTAPDIDQTYQVSVSFGSNQTIAVRFIDYTLTYIGYSRLDTFELNSTFSQLNSNSFYTTPLPLLPNRILFQEAVQSGALSLPFQYIWDIQT